MKAIKHITCKTDIELRRINEESLPFCPRCQKYLELDELTGSGPFAVVQSADLEEAEGSSRKP